jgi:ferrous iron transport protein B
MPVTSTSVSTTAEVETVLLVGHPNVGKSALFNQLTGGDAAESNYPGTTVGYTSGELVVDGESIDVVDVPGTFSLDPKNKAEEVAADILDANPDATVVCVVDATRFERGLNLAIEVIERDYAVALALNMWDEARNGNVDIDVDRLETVLDVPVTPTVATNGEGAERLVDRLGRARSPSVTAIGDRVTDGGVDG